MWWQRFAERNTTNSPASRVPHFLAFSRLHVALRSFITQGVKSEIALCSQSSEQRVSFFACFPPHTRVDKTRKMHSVTGVAKEHRAVDPLVARRQGCAAEVF